MPPSIEGQRPGQGMDLQRSACNRGKRPFAASHDIRDRGGDAFWQRSSLPEGNILHLEDDSGLLLANNIDSDGYQAR